MTLATAPPDGRGPAVLSAPRAKSVGPGDVAGRNERKTEKLVRTHFEADPFPGLILDEQRTDDRRINAALSKASKAGDGVGKPEFILHAPSAPNLVVLIECKALTKNHESQHHDRPKDFAVDGALHYGKAVATVRDVVAIGVSGETKAELRVDSYLFLRGTTTPLPLVDRDGSLDRLVSFQRLIDAVKYDPAKRDAERKSLLAFSRDLHKRMRDKAKLTEQEKPLVVSGILIALLDNFFRKGFRELSPDDLGDRLLEAVERQLKLAIPQAKVSKIVQPYSFISNHEWLNGIPQGESMTPLQTYCADLADQVLPYMQTYGDEDVVGHFYAEFLRYTGGDKKGLGIVLTPRHVTELFCDLADLSPNDTVLDPCAGTGGFLISAMTRMDAAAKDPQKRKEIREKHLVGIEQQPMMFALAASNMLLRGDGKANLYDKSCFDEAAQKAIMSGKKHPRPNKGMMNPSYSQGKGLHELEFVEAMMSMLVPGGIGIAIVPISCGIEPSPQKHRLLEKHTLLAAMSMPEQLFYPTGTITCVFVFLAHHPHATSDKETWFGYWRDDGFRITRTQGRADADHRWAGIRAKWVSELRNHAVVPGESLVRKVGPNDEWCVEAYMETDYSVVDEAMLAEAARKYVIYLATAELEMNVEGEGD